MSFVSLHTHSEFSRLDGMSKLDSVFEKAAGNGQPAIAITDHGRLAGLVNAAQAAKRVGIKHIPGLEAYAVDDRNVRIPRGRGANKTAEAEADGTNKSMFHMIVLAHNQQGYRNLIQLSSRAWTEGFYYEPRIDWELMSDHRQGLMVTTGCLGGMVCQHLLHNRTKEAREVVGKYVDIFGKENVFVELQDHGPECEHVRLTGQLLELARHFNLLPVATPDSHYTNNDDFFAHDALLCCQTRATVYATDRFKFNGINHHFPTHGEMATWFRDIPEAIHNTVLIAERCEAQVPLGNLYVPEFPLPSGEQDNATYLMKLVHRGAIKRWGTLTNELIDRLAFEIHTFNSMGVTDYPLIVADICQAADRMGVARGPGRGSAAGSAVAYALGITNIDPIKYDLLFERFLNPSRVTMPDIDLDFSAEHREKMFRYIEEKYGKDRCAKIGTFMRAGARTAVKDAARVLGMPYDLGVQISAALPPMVMGKDTPLTNCLYESVGKEKDDYLRGGDLRRLYEEDPSAKQVIDLALKLEGVLRKYGCHASAALITPGPLTDIAPVRIEDSKSGQLVTEIDLHNIDDLGGLKVDFLGLSTLDVIEWCKRLIGHEINITLDDEPTIELLRRGDTIGVFQLESPPMRSLLRNVRPDGIEDICAVGALYRPGPMANNMHTDYALRKNGRQDPQPFHPDAKEALESTYGLFVYQEQVMTLSRIFAGYNLAGADSLRRAIGKKDPKKMAEEKDKFIQGCVNQGYGQELGIKLFGMIEAYADYCFNRSHALAYAFVAWETAFLKANYPIEFMAALLSVNRRDLDKAKVQLNECRRMKISILPPDINLSGTLFTREDEAIRIGLACIKGVGDDVAQAIIDERSENGPYTSLGDFALRNMKRSGTKPVIEPLVKGGAFDVLEPSRLALEQIVPNVIEWAKGQKKQRAYGQATLLQIDDEPRPLKSLEFPTALRLLWEREMLGTYVTAHPLDGWGERLTETASIDIGEITDDLPPKLKVSLSGMLTEVAPRLVKRSGDTMATGTLMDYTGNISIVVFPKVYNKVASFLGSNRMIAAHGIVASYNDEVQVILEDVWSLPEAPTVERLDVAALIQATQPPQCLAVAIADTWPDDATAAVWDALSAAEQRGGPVVGLALLAPERLLDSVRQWAASRQGCQLIETVTPGDLIAVAQSGQGYGWQAMGLCLLGAKEDGSVTDCLGKLLASGISTSTIAAPAKVDTSPMVPMSTPSVTDKPPADDAEARHMLVQSVGGKATTKCGLTKNVSTKGLHAAQIVSFFSEVTCAKCKEKMMKK